MSDRHGGAPDGEATLRRIYRLLLLDGSGAVLDSERLEAPGDDEAMAAARARLARHTVELWEGLRFVEQFRPFADPR